MNKEIVVYKIPTSNPKLEGVPMSHVWLHPTDGSHDWNCYGRGLAHDHDLNAQPLKCSPVHGNVEWMSAVYGPDFEGEEKSKQGSYPAAFMREHREGVCQNVANRLLAMTEENADVSEADANELVVFAFGKYGLGVSAFVHHLQDTAFALNARNPGVVVVSDDELKRVLENVRAGQSVAGEVEELIDDLPISLRMVLRTRVSGRRLESFVRMYAGYQVRREAWYEAVIRKVLPSAGLESELEKFLESEIPALLKGLRDCIGVDLYDATVKVLPEKATNVLMAIGRRV